LKPLIPTQSDQGFDDQDADLGDDSEGADFASDNEDIDYQEEEVIDTGQQDEWGEDEWQGISYRNNGEYNVETESSEEIAIDGSAGSQSQQATGVLFSLCTYRP